MAGTTGVKCLDFLLGPLNTPYNAVHAWVWLGGEYHMCLSYTVASLLQETCLSGREP